MSEKRYRNVRKAIEQMASWWIEDAPDADTWAISPEAKDKSLRELEKLESAGMPCPLLCPEDEGSLAFIWQAGDFKLYQIFGKGNTHYFFLPNKVKREAPQ